MFVWICVNCGYGQSCNSGVPSQCECCKKWFTLKRALHKEYQKCKTNDNKIREV